MSNLDDLQAEVAKFSTAHNALNLEASRAQDAFNASGSEDDLKQLEATRVEVSRAEQFLKRAHHMLASEEARIAEAERQELLEERDTLQAALSPDGIAQATAALDKEEGSLRLKLAVLTCNREELAKATASKAHRFHQLEQQLNPSAREFDVRRHAMNLEAAVHDPERVNGPLRDHMAAVAKAASRGGVPGGSDYATCSEFLKN